MLNLKIAEILLKQKHMWINEIIVWHEQVSQGGVNKTWTQNITLK